LKDLLNKKVEGISGPKAISKENMENYNRLLYGNHLYAQEKTFIDTGYFSKKANNHTPKYMMIGCCDARVPPNELTKTEPGDIYIHRNIANLVVSSDLNCMSAIDIAVKYLKVEHIIVMGHTKCGGIAAASECKYLGIINHWLQYIRDVAIKYQDILNKIENEREFLDKLSEFNVREQALNVCKTNAVQQAWAEHQNLSVHGWLCDIDSGHIIDLQIKDKEWADIEHLYGLSYPDIKK